MFLKATAAVVVSVLIYFIVSKMKMMGFHLHYYNHYPGPCSVVESAGLGSEDLEVTSQGQAFITSGVAFSTSKPKVLEYMQQKDIKGRIFLYSFKHPQKGAIALQITPSGSFSLSDFRPHGISVLEDSTKGEHLLYVVNHPFPKPDAVEKFRFKPDTQELIHLKSFTSEQMRITNDLAVLEEDQFYISNFIYSKSPIMFHVETLVPLAWGSILFFDGEEFGNVAPGLVVPNGVTLSKDKRFLYVAMAIEQELRVFEIKADKSLVLVQNVFIHSFPDNLHLSQDGHTIYVGSHPIIHLAMAHLADPWLKAPSQALSFPLQDGLVQVESGEELLYDDGRLIKASTVAAVFDGKLMVGTLHDKLLVCDLKPKS